MESIAEIVLEQILDIDNAIPEHNEPDNDNGKVNLKTGVGFFVLKFSIGLAELNKPSQYKESYHE